MNRFLNSYRMIFCIQWMIIFLILSIHIFQCSSDDDVARKQSDGATVTKFSGVYHPNVKYTAEDFVGAVLLSKPRFFVRPHTNDANLNKVVRTKCKGCNTFMTVDYLDFIVENPSSAMNLLPKIEQIELEKLLQHLLIRLEATRDKLKDVAIKSTSDVLTDSVVAVLLYESSKYGHVTSHIKQVILEASFWSTYRYYKNIVIMVSTNEERKAVKLMRLPIHGIYTMNVENTFINSHPQHHDKSLQWKSLLDIYNRWDSDPEWKDFKFLYYSFGDLIMHQRHSEQLLEVLKVSEEGNFIIVPHRMQTIPMKNFFPEEYHLHWATQPFQDLSNIKLHTQNLATGAPNRCCESGRYHFSNCNTWWYNCPQWGLQNFTEWLQFGTDGYMMPTASVHQGACKYSVGDELCPVEEGCEMRIPQRIGASGSGQYDFCEETHRVRINPMRANDMNDPVIRAERLYSHRVRRSAYREDHLQPGHFAYCAKYQASRTYHGMTNFATCDMYVCNGTKLSISLCSPQSECSGNTLLRLYDSMNHTIQYTGNDDHCDQCSQIVYNFEKPCQWYTIREGCSGSSSCGGRVIVKEFKTVSLSLDTSL